MTRIIFLLLFSQRLHSTGIFLLSHFFSSVFPSCHASNILMVSGRQFSSTQEKKRKEAQTSSGKHEAGNTIIFAESLKENGRSNVIS